MDNASVPSNANEPGATSNEPVVANEISTGGKITAGVLLIVFIIAAVTTVIAFWPDRLPVAGKPARYLYKAFNITLLDSCQSKSSSYEELIKKTADKVVFKKDTTNKDSDKVKVATLKLFLQKADSLKKQKCEKAKIDINDTIEFNTIILILVAAAGFLGNMIHITTSFTTFIGSGQFKSSWVLWYFVKPFTAAALAMIMYFAFRAGFLNSSDPGSNLNIYGVMSISAFVGLFTDVATEKLKEVFGTLFSAKDNRPDKIKPDVKVSVTSVKPEKINVTNPNNFIITGENLDKTKLIISINKQVLAAGDIVIADKIIHFTFTVPADQAALTVFTLLIADDTGKEIFKKDIGV
ncbi:hypothetical protein MTO98_17930 [Mucilaginibacter sp. SMC90]|uniref:hypothetical protein n=1 Tax=Mucilaginibacter sp. SMC90 TaxID=2929803 RepID=UPI001FB25F97|nr:hypothetical protein [Mucilaginibacter sp. SMC90]UOE46281.1 hypothetical protein MTO98_17930 [Mucilaginibacter sp. SMC90]